MRIVTPVLQLRVSENHPQWNERKRWKWAQIWLWRHKACSWQLGLCKWCHGLFESFRHSRRTDQQTLLEQQRRASRSLSWKQTLGATSSRRPESYVWNRERSKGYKIQTLRWPRNETNISEKEAAESKRWLLGQKQEMVHQLIKDTCNNNTSISLSSKLRHSTGSLIRYVASRGTCERSDGVSGSRKNKYSEKNLAWETEIQGTAQTRFYTNVRNGKEGFNIYLVAWYELPEWDWQIRSLQIERVNERSLIHWELNETCNKWELCETILLSETYISPEFFEISKLKKDDKWTGERNQTVLSKYKKLE